MGFIFSKPDKKSQPITSDENVKQKKSLSWKRFSKSNSLKTRRASTETLKAKDSIEKDIVSNHRYSQDSTKDLTKENENIEENCIISRKTSIIEEESQKNSPAPSVYTSDSAMSIVLDGIRGEEWTEKQLLNSF